MKTSLILGDIVNPEKLIKLLNQDASFNRQLLEECCDSCKRNIEQVVCLLTRMQDDQVDVISEHFCKAIYAPKMDGRKFRIVVCSILDAAAVMAPKHFPDEDPKADVVEGSCSHNLIVGTLLGKLSIQGIKPDLSALKETKTIKE